MLDQDGTSDYVWCIHCERTFGIDEFRYDEDNLLLCHYEDCDGTLIDAIDWDIFRGWNKEKKPNLPNIPQKGKLYLQL